MKKVSNSHELLPVNSNKFLNSIGLEVYEVKLLTKDGKPLFLIQTNTNEYVLKVNLPPTNLTGKLRAAFINSVGFQRECMFYKNLKKNEIDNYAKYFNHDEHNLLISVLPKNEVVLKDLKENDWHMVGNALCRFHWNSKLPEKGFKSLIHSGIYGPQSVAFRIGIPTVWGILGLKVAIRFGYEITRCILKQPKLGKICLSHNDFLPNNFIFSKDKNKLSIIDFQDIRGEPRWPFYDLIRLISHLRGNIDPIMKNVLIRSYLQSFPLDIVKSINIESQVRFCVLKGLIHSLLWRINNGHDHSEIEAYLREVLYDNKMDEYDNEIIKVFKDYFYGC